MAITHSLIQTVTVGASNASSIEFLSIPQTYTDLLILYSGRSTRAAIGDDLYIRFNGLSTNLSSRAFYGTGSTVSQFTDASIAYVGYLNGDTSTASVFSNGTIHIANYTGSIAKAIIGDAVNEANTVTATQLLAAGLWTSASAVNQINIFALNGNLKQHSSASLYGIKNS